MIFVHIVTHFLAFVAGGGIGFCIAAFLCSAMKYDDMHPPTT
jgi:hypothetical protein